MEKKQQNQLLSNIEGQNAIYEIVLNSSLTNFKNALMRQLNDVIKTS